METSLDWLHGIDFFGMKPGLKRMNSLAERLGSPQKELKFIHIAGSNGKGSVGTFLESALLKAGFKVGFYSSPHLIVPEERFRVNGKSAGDMKAVSDRVRAVAGEMRTEGDAPSYFELTTALALLYFQQEKVDFVVWETGMGGRLDATNIVTPEISVITGISLEHTAYLGTTYAAIAGEKAGILKPGVPVVTGPLERSAFGVIRAKAEQLKCPFYPVGNYKGTVAVDSDYRQTISIEGSPCKLGLVGKYQRTNALIAARAVRVLADRFGFDCKAAFAGFADASWPARFQILPDQKLIIDGAHNPEGAEGISSALNEMFPDVKFHFITGCFADKDYRKILDFFLPLAKDFSFIEFSGEGRAVESSDAMMEYVSGRRPCEKGVLEEKLSALPGEGWTVLSGSLHLCGKALELLSFSL